VMDDCLANDRAKRGHSLREPRRNASAMKRKISAACSSCYSVIDSGFIAKCNRWAERLPQLWRGSCGWPGFSAQSEWKGSGSLDGPSCRESYNEARSLTDSGGAVDLTVRAPATEGGGS
jgi:hypothetical protein